MDLTIDDIKQLVFELYLAQRENASLRTANAELQQRLAGGPDTRSRAADE